ncbi:MAG: NUDIX hydrolase [Erysipelotrichaceae bacterium]|jgi:8-oxo-dGTP diphosphatase|nr:NUDIX hydrolase [Erysipelotrichaceae bacterium]
MHKFPRLNLIAVYNKECTHVLFCHRQKNPYQGLYNLVGGKLDEGEDALSGAYRELYEETGIGKEDIELRAFGSFSYALEGVTLEIFFGVLKRDVTLVAEANPLKWFSLDTNFFDGSRFAADGNVGHILKIIERYQDIAFAKKQ